MDSYKKKIYEAREINKQKIKDQVSIMDLAKELGFNIEPHGSHFKLKEHDSCILYPDKNKYRRFSTEYAIPDGKSVYKDVFQFLMEFKDLKFNEAYDYLLKKIDPEKTITRLPTKEEKKQKHEKLTIQQRTKSLLNQLNDGLDKNCKNSIAYLIQTRKLDPEIVFDHVSKNMIKQQTNRYGSKNVVFLGYDEHGMLACAEYRSCSSNSNSRGDFQNCDYSYCWIFEPTIDNSSFCPPHDWSKPMIVTEAKIDQLALITLMKNKQLDPEKYSIDNSLMKILKLYNFDYRNFNFLSMGSLNHWRSITELSKKFGIDKWILAPDNDSKGMEFLNKVTPILKDANLDVHCMLPIAKDWDQDLINLSVNLQQRINRNQSKHKENNITDNNKKIIKESKIITNL